MPIISGWGTKTYQLDWETEKVAYIYDSQPGPSFFTYPMTGLLPVNIVTTKDLQDLPSPCWITYIDTDSDLGKIDSKGDKTYILSLPNCFEAYIDSLDYSSRKEMRYVLKKNSDLLTIENKKSDLFLWVDDYFAKINQRAISEGENPFSTEGIRILKEIFLESCVHTISIILPASGELLAVNVSFRKNHKVYDSFCIRNLVPNFNSRSLGTFAILKNIEFAIRDGFKKYDMLSGDWGYKHKFGAVATCQKVYIKCNLEFANHYQIPLDDISEIVEL